MSIPVDRGIKAIRNGGFLTFSQRFLDYLGVWKPAWNTVTSRHKVGTNVFDLDWDMLVILDACRVDALRYFADSISWLDEVEQMTSVGSTSAEWVLKTFQKNRLEDIEQTALVSRNFWSKRIFDDRVHERRMEFSGKTHDNIRMGYTRWNPITSDDLAHHERVEPLANQDDRIHPESTSVPHIVTDRAISVGRNKNPERMIVWYAMPHLKFIADAVDWTEGETSLETLMSGPEPTRDLEPEERSYDPGRRGEVSRSRYRELYLQNLRFVLDYVEILLQNVDAERVVVSADHGEALGEVVWGHPLGYPFSPVKTVPWATTSATDEQTYNSQYAELNRSPVQEEQREILKDLGYI